MKNEVKTFRLFVRPDEKSQQIANKIKELNARKETPLLEADDADLVIAIGGDGTFIHAVTETQFDKKIVYTGIHTGTLGFLQDLCEDNIFTLIQYIDFEKELKTRKVYTASVEVFMNNGTSYRFSALNEAVIAGENYSKISFAEYIHGELLQNVTGSGIIVATPTGDTAFSLNAKGAIDFSNNFQLVRTLIAPIKNAANASFIENPIICTKISLVLKPASNISIIIDGIQKNIDSNSIERIEISMDDSNFINKLDLMNYSKVGVIRNKILGY